MAPSDDTSTNNPTGRGEVTAVPADETTPLLVNRDPEPGQESATEPAAQSRQSYWISLAFGLFLILVFIILVVLLAVFRPGRDKMLPSTALCLTPACIHAADKLLTSLSPNYQKLDPCTDFEECEYCPTRLSGAEMS